MISVIIPVYNGEKYLDECLFSVKNAGVEIIVVNDGSTDNSAEIASKYTDHVISIENSGPVHARNLGLEKSTGEFVLFMDADDVMVPGALDILQDKIAGFDGVIGLRQDFMSPDANQTVSGEQKKSTHGVIAGCALFKKSVFDTVGNFDEDLLCGDAYDWLLRAEKCGIKLNKIDDVLCMRRIHNSNMGRTLKDREYTDYCKIIKKHFVRK